MRDVGKAFTKTSHNYVFLSCPKSVQDFLVNNYKGVFVKWLTKQMRQFMTHVN